METNKYIIELEETIVSTADGQIPCYKIKGFDAPMFDEIGISKLTPYKEQDVDVIRTEMFTKGYRMGYDDGYNRGYKDTKELILKYGSILARTGQ